MRDLVSWRTAMVRLGVCLLAVAAARGGAADEPTFRDLVRKYVKDGNGKQLGTLVGFSQEVQHVVALEYTVLLKSGDQEKAVDPKRHEFQLGDQIRVRIRPLSDAYIYIFHEGASGKRACLLPTAEEKAPFVKREATIDLPSDGYFEFSAPPGNEELLVVATEKPTADLAGMANVVFNKPDDQLTPAEKEIKRTLKATVHKTLKSIRDRQASTTTYRGLLNEKALQAHSQEVRRSGATRSVLEEPPSGNNASALAVAVGAKADSPTSLCVNIPLKSIKTK